MYWLAIAAGVMFSLAIFPSMTRRSTVFSVWLTWSSSCDTPGVNAVVVTSGTTPLAWIQLRSSSISAASCGIVGSRLLNAPQSASLGSGATVVVVAPADVSGVEVVLAEASVVGGVVVGEVISSPTFVG